MAILLYGFGNLTQILVFIPIVLKPKSWGFCLFVCFKCADQQHDQNAWTSYTQCLRVFCMAQDCWGYYIICQSAKDLVLPHLLFIVVSPDLYSGIILSFRTLQIAVNKIKNSHIVCWNGDGGETVSQQKHIQSNSVLYCFFKKNTYPDGKDVFFLHTQEKQPRKKTSLFLSCHF